MWLGVEILGYLVIRLGYHSHGASFLLNTCCMQDLNFHCHFGLDQYVYVCVYCDIYFTHKMSSLDGQFIHFHHPLSK